VQRRCDDRRSGRSERACRRYHRRAVRRGNIKARLWWNSSEDDRENRHFVGSFSWAVLRQGHQRCDSPNGETVGFPADRREPGQPGKARRASCTARGPPELCCANLRVRPYPALPPGPGESCDKTTFDCQVPSQGRWRSGLAWPASTTSTSS
jgi:hypothetical protein